MLLPFRGQQQRVFNETTAAVSDGLNPLIVAPCGFGKGVLIAHLIHAALESAKRHGHSISIIFAVHGNSLVVDLSQRLTRAGIPHGVLMGSARRQRWHPVQVASLDTLARMTHPPECDLFIVDEAHLAIAPVWARTIRRFPNARIIGMTATPIRMDGRGLGKKATQYQHPDRPRLIWDGSDERPKWLEALISEGGTPNVIDGGFFDVMINGPSVQNLIDEKYLVRSRVLEPPAVEGAKEIRLKKGDDKLAQQAAVFDKVKLIGDEIGHYKQYAEGRKGVTFGADKKHAYHIAEEFTKAGIPWVYVDADTPLGDEKNPQPGTRAAIWRDLDAENGNLMGVSNCGITKIGWDHSIVSYLGIMRLFGSIAEWIQVQGRGSRTHPGKYDFLVIDHGGSRAYHGDIGYFEYPVEWSLDGEGIKTGSKKTASIKTCKNSWMNCECGKPVRLDRDGLAEPGYHDRHGTHWPCYGHWTAAVDECPFCGCPILRAGRTVETDAKAALVERERVVFHEPPARIPDSLAAKVAGEFRLTSQAPVVDRRELVALLDQARKTGRKPGWAKHVLEGRGVRVPVEWMPREWREEKGL